MKNFILEQPFFYRFYQSFVRVKKNEYVLFDYIFSVLKKKKKIKLLDICSGDSHVLNYIHNHLDNYLGIDFNEKYLKNLKEKYPKYNFLNLNVKSNKTKEIIKKYKPNFIFMNGAIHHLDDKSLSEIVNIINYYKRSYFLSVDPIKYKNKFINNLMIKLDRGKFIRDKIGYKKVMKKFNSLIVEGFYIMSFQNIFHYKNFNLKKLYKKWNNKY